MTFASFFSFAIIAYQIWKASYNSRLLFTVDKIIIAYQIWKASYNALACRAADFRIIAYQIWNNKVKDSYLITEINKI